MERLARRRIHRLALAGVLSSVLLLTGCASVIRTFASSGSTATSSVTPTTATASATPSETPSETPVATPSATPSEELVSGVTKLPDGRLQVTDAETGFRVALPRGYVRITNAKQLEQILRAGSKATKSKLPPSAVTAFSKNIKLFGINKLTGTSVNMIVTPANGMIGTDLPGEADSIATALKVQTHATSVKTRPITVDGDQALRADATLSYNGIRVRSAQVYAISDDQLFVITFSGAIPESTISAVLGSLHFAR